MGWSKNNETDKDGYFWKKMGKPECEMMSTERCGNCSYACWAYHSLTSLLDEAKIPRKYRAKKELVASTEIEEVEQRLIRNYIDDMEQNIQEGKGLHLYSATKGNGKTSWAIKILRSYLETIALKLPDAGGVNIGEGKAVFVNVPAFLTKLTLADYSGIEEYQEEVAELRQKIRHAELVVWDDLGREKSSEYSQRILYILVNDLYTENKIQIVTSNYSMEQLEESGMVGETVMDRLFENNSQVRFSGKGKRRN